ncbi:MAG: glycine cleavage system protein H [Acidobacteria bacterium]|jgi:glycine cleavage system H protein|nr:MAG: glycine cleavage system protein H [Acidobacteriota bacterium]
MTSRRVLLKLFLSVPFLSWTRKMEDIDVLGCKIKRDRLYRVNEERMLFQWIKEEKKGIYSVGFMQVLSSLIYPLYAIKIKPVGTKVEYDGNLAVVESGKKVSTFPSPLSGVVVGVNHALEKDPSPIVSKPYESWIVKIESSNPEEIKRLKRAEDVIDVVKRTIISERIECLPKTH